MSGFEKMIKWGIAGCGKISADFVNSISVLTSLIQPLHSIVAAAARKQEDADAFSKHWSIPTAYGSYEELAKDKNVDTVYIGVIHPHHASLCKLFINAGKNVLCEKPLGMNAQETQDVLALAKEKNIFFMEGFWTRFFPVYDDLRAELHAGTIGEVVCVTANFGVKLETPRVLKKELGGGAMLDLGCYALQFSQLVFKEKPFNIQCSGKLNEEGVDVLASIILTYSWGRTAVLNITSLTKTENSAFVYGTKGYIKLHDPLWCPTIIEVNGSKKEFPMPEAKSKMNFYRSEGLSFEAEAVRQAITQGLTEHPLMSFADSLDVAEISDAIQRQLGVAHCQQ